MTRPTGNCPDSGHTFVLELCDFSEASIWMSMDRNLISLQFSGLWNASNTRELLLITVFTGGGAWVSTKANRISALRAWQRTVPTATWELSQKTPQVSEDCKLTRSFPSGSCPATA